MSKKSKGFRVVSKAGGSQPNWRSIVDQFQHNWFSIFITIVGILLTIIIGLDSSFVWVNDGCEYIVAILGLVLLRLVSRGYSNFKATKNQAILNDLLAELEKDLVRALNKFCARVEYSLATRGEFNLSDEYDFLELDIKEICTAIALNLEAQFKIPSLAAFYRQCVPDENAKGSVFFTMASGNDKVDRKDTSTPLKSNEGIPKLVKELGYRTMVYVFDLDKATQAGYYMQTPNSKYLKRVLTIPIVFFLNGGKKDFLIGTFHIVSPGKNIPISDYFAFYESLRVLLSHHLTARFFISRHALIRSGQWQQVEVSEKGRQRELEVMVRKDIRDMLRLIMGGVDDSEK